MAVRQRRARRTNKSSELSADDWSAIRRFAAAWHKGGFNEYVELLQHTPRLLWKSFLQGVAKGFGAVVGATIVFALLLWILAALGDNLPGELGDFFTQTSQQIEQQQSATAKPN